MHICIIFWLIFCVIYAHNLFLLSYFYCFFLVVVFTYVGNYRNTSGVFGIAAAATAITLFLLGALQGGITRQNIALAGTYMMINGSLAAAAAYAISVGILHIIGNGTQAC